MSRKVRRQAWWAPEAASAAPELNNSILFSETRLETRLYGGDTPGGDRQLAKVTGTTTDIRTNAAVAGENPRPDNRLPDQIRLEGVRDEDRPLRLDPGDDTRQHRPFPDTRG